LAKTIKWSSSDFTTSEELDTFLARQFMQALGVAGTEEALMVLKSHRCATGPCPFLDVLQDAIAANKEVQEKGLAAYLTASSR
jgi:hypothetical protein